jgi:hypothetical protein
MSGFYPYDKPFTPAQETFVPQAGNKFFPGWEQMIPSKGTTSHQ